MGLSPFRKSVVEALELDESTVSRACCVPMGRSHRCPKSTALSGAYDSDAVLVKSLQYVADSFPAKKYMEGRALFVRIALSITRGRSSRRATNPRGATPRVPPGAAQGSREAEKAAQRWL